ncbi:MAG: hypothetical protein ACRERX_15935 [Pseudomonas sp.]
MQAETLFTDPEHFVKAANARAGQIREQFQVLYFTGWAKPHSHHKQSLSGACTQSGYPAATGIALPTIQPGAEHDPATPTKR